MKNLDRFTDATDEATILIYKEIAEAIVGALRQLPRLTAQETYEHMAANEPEPFSIGILSALLAHLTVFMEVHRKTDDNVEDMILAILPKVRARHAELIDGQIESWREMIRAEKM